MSQIKAKRTLKTVQYMGQNMDIPANHNWLAIIKILSSDPNRVKNILVSYSEEPKLSAQGSYHAVEGSEDTFIAEVEYAGKLSESLVYVGEDAAQAQTAEHCILANLAELADKIQLALKSNDPKEQIIHDICCPEHGELAQFIDATLPAIAEVLGAETKEPEPQDIPEEVKQALRSIFGSKQRYS